jgi:hypothetical protein
MKKMYTKESAVKRVEKVGCRYQQDSNMLFVETPIGIHSKGAVDYLIGVHHTKVVYGKKQA